MPDLDTTTYFEVPYDDMTNIEKKVKKEHDAEKKVQRKKLESIKSRMKSFERNMVNAPTEVAAKHYRSKYYNQKRLLENLLKEIKGYPMWQLRFSARHWEARGWGKIKKTERRKKTFLGMFFEYE